MWWWVLQTVVVALAQLPRCTNNPNTASHLIVLVCVRVVVVVAVVVVVVVGLLACLLGGLFAVAGCAAFIAVT